MQKYTLELVPFWLIFLVVNTGNVLSMPKGFVLTDLTCKTMDVLLDTFSPSYWSYFHVCGFFLPQKEIFAL